MDELCWELLVEIYDRLEAEMIKAALEAEGIPAELSQEGAGHSVYPVTVGSLGLVQIFIPKEKVADARTWLDAYKNNTINNHQSFESNNTEEE
jgi:hypothetical protein